MEKTFNATEAEARIYRAWEDAGAFKAGANASSDETFSIMIPPPNVTGVLHMGHAFNNTLQDILTRWHRMQGHDTLWQPGTDHAGIATQMVVERELAEEGNQTRREMGREKFIARVWDQKVKSRNNIKNQLSRIGASCDWSREAFTMSGAPGAPAGEEGNFHDAVIKVFVKMYEDGLIYRGKRLVNWDPHFETAISDLEVENIEVDGHMWHFKYPLADGVTYEYVEKDKDGVETLRETRDYISIATTRPETMLGDGAVAVHPSDERYASIVGKLCEIPVGPKEHRRLIPIITDEYPDPDFGSGAVKITGAHDFNDYQVAKRGGIPMYRLMDTKGAMRDDGVPYAEAAAIAMRVAKGEQILTEAEADTINLVPDDLRGLDRFVARAHVTEQISSEGLAVMTSADDPRLGRVEFTPPEDGIIPQVPLVEAKKIMAPYGDRSKVVIEPMLTDQWFVDTDKIVGPALEAVRNGTTEILPEQHKKVYFNWLENIEPWCISRQLWWGHQIPVWYGFDLAANGFIDDESDGALDETEIFRLLAEQSLLKGDERHHAAAEFEEVAKQFSDILAGLPMPLNHARVVEVEDRAAALHAISTAMADYNVSQDPTHLIYPVWRDADVLDTWFSSGLWPIGTLGWPEDTEELKKYFPTSVLITGFDIIFFWVARMMMMQYATVGDRPFDTVYVHALVRDEKGKKMSKSLGNVLDPLDIIDEFGADAMRFTLTSMAAMGRDLKLSTQRIQGYRNFTTKLWNASRFAEMNGVFDVALSDRGPEQATHTVNKWIIGEVAKTRLAVDEALEKFRFNDAAATLYAFTYTYCDWYLEFSKPLMDTDAATETKRTMAWALDQLLIMMHPVMPFITEELWSLSGTRDKMLVTTNWPTYGTELIDEVATAELNWVRDLIEKTRSIRGEMNVPKKQKAPLLKISLDASGQAALANNEAIILRDREAGIEGFQTVESAPKGAATIAVAGGTFALPLEGLIDVDAEKARLEKSAQKLQKELGGLTGRLKNPKFIESAPDDVIAETKELAAQKEEEMTRLQTALTLLGDL